MKRAALLLCLCAAGCLSPALDETGKRCRASSQACGAGYTCLVGRCVPGEAPVNLLVNGDFEDANVRAGWSLTEHLAPTPERTQVQHGAQSLRLTLTERESNSPRISPQVPPVKDGAGHLFCLAGYAAAPGLSSGLSVSFVEGSADGGTTSTRVVSTTVSDELAPFSAGREGRAGSTLSLQVSFSGERQSGDGLLLDDFSLWESVDGGCP